MIHTFEILYVLNRRAATYCAYKLNRHVNAAERYSHTDLRRFIMQLHIRRNSCGIHFRGLRIPGIHQIDLLKYKAAPGNFFLYIMIEPEVLLTGENTLNVFFCCPVNAKQLQTNYARAIYQLFPKSFKGRPTLTQVRYHDQGTVHDDEWKNWTLYNIPYMPLSFVSRIDFCLNYKLDNASLYVEMIQKSYYSARKKKIKFKNLNPFSQNRCHDFLYYDKTSGFLVYNKFDKMMDPEKDEMHNICQIREEAENVIRIERPFYKISKQKLFSISGMVVPAARTGEEAPLKMGPLPFLADETIGIRTIFKEYMQRVLGIKRTELQHYDIVNYPSLKWVSCKRFRREMDRILESGRITRQRHEIILKMAYATSEARSVMKAVQNCNTGTHVWWGRDDDDDENKVRVAFQRSTKNFTDVWHDMHHLGIMLARIPNEREVHGVENNDWNARELDANFIFNTDNLVGIGTILDKETSSHFDFLPYRVVRGYDTPDPLEVRHNYSEVLERIYARFVQYLDDSQTAYLERIRRRREELETGAAR